MVLRDDLGNGHSQRTSLFSGESSSLYGARIGQIVRLFELTRLEPNDTLTQRMNCKLV
jgi:hypothetical protein